MPDKNVIIVGAGIAGLSAGVYAAKAGFNTIILESHIIPGGLSTSWKRKGYLFEGGMHWLTGSSEKLTLNQIWKETGALQENNPIFNKDPFYTLISGNKRLHLYKNIDKFAKHLLEYAPEDKKAIKRLRRDVKLFEGVHMPVSDVPGLKAKKHYRPSLIELLKMAPAVLRLAALTKQSYIDYVFKFNNKDVRHLLMTVIGTRYNALSFIYTLASYSSGDCGYPEGGSLRMSKNMADTFENHGGKIQYRTFVEKVEIENNKVVKDFENVRLRINTDEDKKYLENYLKDIEKIGTVGKFYSSKLLNKLNETKEVIEEKEVESPLISELLIDIKKADQIWQVYTDNLRYTNIDSSDKERMIARYNDLLNTINDYKTKGLIDIAEAEKLTEEINDKINDLSDKNEIIGYGY